MPHTFEVTRLALMSGDRFVSGSTDKTTRITEYGRALDNALKAKRKAEAVQNELKVAQLEAMGFEWSAARVALKTANGDLLSAAALCNARHKAALEEKRRRNLKRKREDKFV